MLRAIASNNGVMTPSEIAEWTQTERHNIAALVDRMRRDGLAAAEPNSREKRVVNVGLADKRWEVLSQAMRVVRGHKGA